MKESVMKQMRSIVGDLMTYDKWDFEVYDTQMLDEYEGEFWWCVWDCGTFLVKIELDKINNEKFVYSFLNGTNDAQNIAESEFDEGAYFFRYSGVPYECLEQVSQDELKGRVEQLKSYILANTLVEIPKRVKRKVFFSEKESERIEMRRYLKQQLKYADSKGDETLRTALSNLHNKPQKCHNHICYLKKEDTYGLDRSFSYEEFIYRTVRKGGIIYHEDTERWETHN